MERFNTNYNRYHHLFGARYGSPNNRHGQGNQDQSGDQHNQDQDHRHDRANALPEDDTNDTDTPFSITDVH